MTQSRMHEIFENSGLPLVPNKLLRVPSVGSLAAATTSSAQLIKFPRRALVIGIVGQVKEATDVGLASAEARIIVRADRDLFIDGNGGVFMPFMALFGLGKPFFPLGIPVEQAEPWTVYLKNAHAATTYTPDLIFLLREEG